MINIANKSFTLLHTDDILIPSSCGEYRYPASVVLDLSYGGKSTEIVAYADVEGKNIDSGEFCVRYEYDIKGSIGTLWIGKKALGL